jgi:hypothetical protein
MELIEFLTVLLSLHLYTDKKENKIVLIYKEIQKGHPAQQECMILYRAEFANLKREEDPIFPFIHVDEKVSRA